MHFNDFEGRAVIIQSVSQGITFFNHKNLQPTTLIPTSSIVNYLVKKKLTKKLVVFASF